ncbi:MAG: hypothetical protein E7270_01130 [Lachnospiraceae bacterium]|nr:hypothetical protein [Lachnospiraceae bacterium]
MEYNTVVDFLHRSTSYPLDALSAVMFGNVVFENHTVMDTTSNGFEIQGCWFVNISDGSVNFVTGTSVEYVAVKYT